MAKAKLALVGVALISILTELCVAASPVLAYDAVPVERPGPVAGEAPGGSDADQTSRAPQRPKMKKKHRHHSSMPKSM